MSKSKTTDGWSLDEGLAAQYAAQAGLDPELAAAAGNKAWDVLKSLRDAADEPDPKRRNKLVKRTQRRLKEAGLGQCKELAIQIAARLAELSREQQCPNINPKTGLQEFALECVREGENCESTPIPLDQQSPIADPMPAVVHNFTYTADGALSPNQPGITHYRPGQFTGSFSAPDLRSQDGGTQVLGHIVPSESSYSGTVPMPTEGAYVDLTDGVDAVSRNPNLVPDNVLEWALQEGPKEWESFYFGPGGQSLIWGNPLGGRSMVMKEHQRLYRRHLDLLGEKQRRQNSGEWALD